jgi:L-seryl-tRNA(Ser) seleniumtransferase
VEITQGRSVTGGGSLPGRSVETALISIRRDRPQLLAKKLRERETPIIARVERGTLVLDLRTVARSDDAALKEALRALTV